MTAVTDAERAEAAEIAARRHDVIFGAGRIDVWSVVHAEKAAVDVSTSGGVTHPISATLKASGTAHTIYLDAATAHALATALLEVVVVCPACKQPKVRGVETERCPEVGDELCVDGCHRAMCDRCFDAAPDCVTAVQ